VTVGDEPIEEIVTLGGGRELLVLRPRDPESLLSEEAFEQEEFLPYWAELWPSALALARAVAARALRGARVVELGCGLALPSIVAAQDGGRVLATDWAPDAIAFAQRNARHNGVELDTAVESWTDPRRVTEQAPWDLVLGSDLLYEARNVEPLLALLPQLVDQRGEVWIADPGRAPAERFLAAAAERFEVHSTRDDAGRRVHVHRLRPR
jgi:predicted nicotinamide N-methyase